MRPSEKKRLSNVQIGLIAIVLTFIGFYLAFTKSIPFAGHGYQLKAVVADAQNIRAKSPVRISGVDVGEVSDVQHLTDANGKGEDAAVVTMDLKDAKGRDGLHIALVAPSGTYIRYGDDYPCHAITVPREWVLPFVGVILVAKPKLVELFK